MILSPESKVRDPVSRTLPPKEEVLEKSTRSRTKKKGIQRVSPVPTVSEVLSHASHEAVIHEYDLIQDCS
jgi:hypothetical protein